MMIIRRATLEDKDKIFSFIKKAYKGRWQYKIPDRWEWEFVDNPYLPDENLPIWIAINDSGEVVGQSCALMEPLKLGDTLQTIGWGVDLFVDSSVRGQGLGYELKKQNDANQDVFMSLSVAPITQRINKNLGFDSLPPVSIYLRVLDPDPLIFITNLVNLIIPKGEIIKKYLIRLCQLLAIDKLLIKLKQNRREKTDTKIALQIDKNIEILQVTNFNAELDDLWQIISPGFHTLVKRDQKYLNWKYVQQPHVEYKKFIARRKGQISGYLILRNGVSPEPNIGIITDLFAAQDDMQTITSLLSYSVKYFKNEQVRSIISATNIQTYHKLLEIHGFKKIKEDIPTVHFNKKNIDNKISLQPGNWFLSKGDHDWDQYPLATDSP